MIAGTGCQCCGDDDLLLDNGRVQRCAAHADRNPCAIEGCKRTISVTGRNFSNRGWICADHWRVLVPAKSLERRVYHRYFRKAKREGWTPDLRRRFWRFWDALVARAEKRTQNGEDLKAEVDQIMGWDRP